MFIDELTPPLRTNIYTNPGEVPIHMEHLNEYLNNNLYTLPFRDFGQFDNNCTLNITLILWLFIHNTILFIVCVYQGLCYSELKVTVLVYRSTFTLLRSSIVTLLQHFVGMTVHWNRKYVKGFTDFTV